MQSKFLNLPPALIAFGGVAVITLGFWVLVPSGWQTSTAWLTYVVAVCVYLANVSSFTYIGAGTDSFDERIPRIGITWAGRFTYTLLAIGGLATGLNLVLPFKYIFVYELAAAFIYVVFLVGAGMGTKQAAAVARFETNRTNSLRWLKTAAADCDGALRRLPTADPVQLQKLRSICDGIRYLSPCSAEAAISLETEIAEMLHDIPLTATAGAGRADEELLSRCETLLQLRKQQRET